MLVSDLELLTELRHHIIVEISGIVRDDGLWETESAHKIVFEEPCDDFFCNPCIGFCLDPFCKVVDSHQYKAVTIR